MINYKRHAHLISIAGKDQLGVVSAVTGYLFEIGADLADTAYVTLGQGFEFSCVADLDNVMTAAELEEGLVALSALEKTRINVVNFPFNTYRQDNSEVSHILELQGGDRAGLVSRISDILQHYGANIIRMNSRRIDGRIDHMGNNCDDYRMRFALNIAHDKLPLLQSALTNTAGSLRLKIDLSKV